MDTDLKHDRFVRVREWISNAVRSRLGNALVVLNALWLVRSSLLTERFECDHLDCPLVGDPVGDVCIFLPPITTIAYNLVHLPTWVVLWMIEGLARPIWTHLCIATAFNLEAGLFLWLSCIQWLVFGAYVQTWLEHRRARRKIRAELAVAPEPAQLNLFNSSSVAARAR